MSSTLERRLDLTLAWKPVPKRLDLTQAYVWPKTVVLGVHDGDTITVDVDMNVPIQRGDQPLGFHTYVQGHHLHYHDAVRLFGLNAPELATPTGKASQLALAAKVPVGTTITLTTWLDRNDKYGRILGNIALGAMDINQWLIDNHWALPWDGHGVKPV